MILGNTEIGKTLDIIQRELSTITYRQNVIANNIANQDTPNFKRSTVNFETHLKEALQSEKHVPEIVAAKTHKGHVDFFDPIDYRSVTPRRVLDWQTQADNNGNNVDIDVEAVEQIKWTQMFQLLSKSMSESFKKNRHCIRSVVWDYFQVLILQPQD